MTTPVARVVIADEDRVLLIRLTGDVYLLPGGESAVGEETEAALRRHTAEQTGYDVQVGELLWIREHTTDDLVELFYRGALSGGAVAAAHRGGANQTGVEWIGRERLSEMEFLPRSLLKPLAAFLTDRAVVPPVYLTETP